MDNIDSSRADTRENWSYVRETITMIHLAVCQIKASLSESDHSVNHLTDSFTTLANHTRQIEQLGESLEKETDLAEVKSMIDSNSAVIHGKIGEAVEAFQFYDRISQRLDHVTQCLEGATTIMSDREQLTDPVAWQSIQEKVKTSYTMESERQMFEQILKGATVQEALQAYEGHLAAQENSTAKTHDEEIELF